MKKRAVFFGTPDFARSHLQTLLECPNYEVVGVVSQPDRPAGRKMQLQPSPVKQLALEKSIPVITPEKIRTGDALETVKSWQPDVCVVVAYGQIFPKDFLNAFPRRVVNVHGSILPRWRGAAPIQRAIMAGDKETGVCLQIMVPELDAGDVIGERKLPISPDMNAIHLHDQMKSVGAELLKSDLLKYLNGEIQPKQQDASKVTYARKIDKSEATVDWGLQAEEIHNRFRGLVMGPGTKTSHRGMQLKLTNIKVGSADKTGTAGEVVDVRPEYLEVQTGLGTIQITELQPESRQRMAFSEFLKGYPLEKGERLGE